MASKGSTLLFYQQSLAGSFNSAIIDTLGYDGASLTISWTGTAVGTAIPQGSSDGVNFDDYDMTQGVLNNAADSCTFALGQLPTQFLRVAYTSTSGTGLMSCYYNLKGGL